MSSDRDVQREDSNQSSNNDIENEQVISLVSSKKGAQSTLPSSQFKRL